MSDKQISSLARSWDRLTDFAKANKWESLTDEERDALEAALKRVWSEREEALAAKASRAWKPSLAALLVGLASLLVVGAIFFGPGRREGLRTSGADASPGDSSSRRGPSNFKPFQAEVIYFRSLQACGNPQMDPKASPQSFSCLEGRAGTARLLLLGREGSDQLDSVRVVWRDWIRDRGYGLHADRREAANLVAAVSGRYAPRHRKALEKAFLERERVRLSTDFFDLEVTHDRGALIDEHALIVTSR